MAGLTRADSAAAAGTTVTVLGLGFLLVHLIHAVEEAGEQLPAVVFGGVLPLSASVLIVAVGIWMAGRDWGPVSPWLSVGWCVAGLLAGVGLIGLLVLYERAEGVRLSHVEYVIAMFGTYGSAIGLLLARYDTQRRRRAADRRRKTERLEEFTSLVSHDLRNPLNVAQGRLELAREEDDAEQLDAVARAHERMEGLIDDLLSAARAGEAVTDPAPVRLGEVAEGCWQAVDTRAASLVADAEQSIVADPAALQQLLENLFRNAVEHGGDGVTVTVGELDGGFYVADDGAGLSVDRPERVFETGFSTADGNTGLGLAIVRDIADAHGWSVGVTAGEQGGARFEFTGVERPAG
ncbi:MAG: sensor histidine kinase [Halobacteriales archaeon]